jgi:hypothetical protein
MEPIDFETFIVQIEPDGLACLSALAIKSPQPIGELCRLIRLGERKVKEIMIRLERFGYAGQAAPIDATNWHITNKARAIIAALFQHFIGHGSDPRQLPLLTGSNPDHLAPAESDPAFVEEIALRARRAQHALIHSDQIIDQINSDSDHDSEMNETQKPPRDAKAVARALDLACIRDLPGKANRTRLLSDPWTTPERIEAALARARNNPLRKSPNPIGLAVAELLNHRPEIDAWIEARQTEAAGTVDPTSQPVIDDRASAIATARAEIKRIEDAMNVATWDDHQLLIIDRQKAYAALHKLIEVTA